MKKTRRDAMLGFVRQMILATLLPVAAAAGADATAPAIGRLDGVTIVPHAGSTTVLIKTSSPARYQAALIDSPDRLVIDLLDTTFAWRQASIDVSTPPLRRVRGSQFKKGVSRIVVELAERAPYVINDAPDGIAVVLTASTRTVAARPVATPDVLFVDTSSAKLVRLPDVPREPVRLAQATVTPPPPAPAPPAAPSSAPVITGTGRLISFDFKDADVVNLLRILAAESGRNIVISDAVKGKMSLTLRNVPWDQALEIILESRGLEKVEKGNVLRVVTREELAKERETLAKAEEARVKSEEVKARADAEIRQKTAEAALKEQEAQQRKLAVEAAIAEQQARGPLVEETIRLAYADPEDVAATLQGLLGITGGGSAGTPAPIVPPAGPPFSALYGAPGLPPLPPPLPTAEVLAKGITIRAHKPTNSIFIRHYQKDLERIKKLIRETLDVQLPQIKIEARLNELSRSDLFDIGVAWNGAGFRRDGRNVLSAQGVNPGSGSATSLFAPATGTPGGIPPAATSPVPIDKFGNPSTNAQLPALSLPVSGLTGLPLGGNLVNLPLSLGAPTAGIGFGIIGTRFSINLALEALEKQTKSRSLAKPEIVTTENTKASISLGTEIPYATVSSAGTQVQFKEAVLKLEVTPTVVREPNVTKIKMKVLIDNNSPQGLADNGSLGGTLPTIAKRHAETEVVVAEGETLVIGGITQRAESENINKVPFLGDVPVLGWLFKTRSRAVNPDNELVVFITPTVIRDMVRGTGPTAPRPR